jgi:hypothetical protein
LNVSFSVLEIEIMSFDILPKRTSIIESVKMSKRHVLSVKMMIIFFQKLSCINQVFNLAKQDIFLRVYFIQMFQDKNNIIIYNETHQYEGSTSQPTIRAEAGL